MLRTESGKPGDARELVLAHQAGDPNAFDEMVRLHYPAMLHHARRRLNDAKVAEDVVQDTFLRAYRALPLFNGEYQLGAWLHRILVNVCLTEISRRRRESEGNQLWVANSLAPESPGPEEHAEQIEAMARVIAAVNKLSPAYREAFVLRDVMELDYADVANRTGITEVNARARVHRARAALRRIVEKAGAVGAIAWWPVRRAGRFGTVVGEHINSAGVYVTPDMVQATGTRASAFGAIATTGAAVAAAASVPFFMGSASPIATPTPAPAPATRVSTPDKQPAAAIAAIASPVSPKAPTSSLTTLLVTTTLGSTTTTVAPTTTTAAHGTVSTPASPPVAAPASSQPAPAPSGPAPLATLHSDQVVTNAGSGVTEEPATLHEPNRPDALGRLNTQILVPPPGGAYCQGRIRGRFTWAVTSADPTGDQATFDAVFVDGSRQGDATLYRFRGHGTVTGSDQQLDGDKGYTGTVLVPDSGSVGTLDVQFLAPDQVNQPATCAPAGQWQSTPSASAALP